MAAVSSLPSHPARHVIPVDVAPPSVDARESMRSLPLWLQPFLT